MEKIYNENLTKDELNKIEELVNNVGDYGEVKIIKTNGIIDIVYSKRTRIKEGKKMYKKG